MKAPVSHINLLQRQAPAHATAWGLAALVSLAVAGMLYYGGQVRSVAREAEQRRDQVAAQLKQLQDRLAGIDGQQAHNAQSLALRAQIDALQPKAQAAQALLETVRQAEGARTEAFSQALSAMTGVSEPGLWLTSIVVSQGGRKIELQGNAHSGASVLRYAHRTNESLQRLALRLDSLEMQPAAPVAAASAADSGTVSFHLH